MSLVFNDIIVWVVQNSQIMSQKNLGVEFERLDI